MTELNAKLRSELIKTAHAMADAARPVTLKYFRAPDLIPDNKLSVGFDPVTVADREAEFAMRQVLKECRPQDGVLGEELGLKTGSSGLTWVLDPIDGTRGYISGTPTWGILIAVNAGAAPLFGIIDQPFTGERFAGGFGISETTIRGETTATTVRSVPDLEKAVIFSTFPEVGTVSEAKAFHRLARQCRLTRYGTDCYAYALLAAGHVDLVAEAGLNAYDAQAPIAVVEAAGGIVTNWQGGPAYGGGTILAAGSKTLHEKAMQILNEG